jgi:ATP:ADP antiporter, AAA family
MKSDESVVTARLAALAAMLVIAYQVASKAVRDAFFLSSFPVTTLPAMLASAAIISVLVSLFAARWMSRAGPSRVATAGFGLSAGLQLVEWGLAGPFPREAAVLIFLHVATLGPVLASGFWSVVSERFDPHSARRRMARVAAAGTLGGLLGGIAAERAAVLFGVAGVLPCLAGLHVLCALVVGRLGHDGAASETRTVGLREGLRLLAGASYVRPLWIVLLLVTTGAALMDYVFKAWATDGSVDGTALMRLFSVYYIVVAVVSFIVQTGLSRSVIERAGIGGAIATLPAGIVTGSAALLVFPGLWTAAIARGVEAMLRHSLFRSGYELLFAPIPRAQKRATKTLVDVGGDRFGDIAGGGLVALVLALVPGHARPALLVLAIALGFTTLWITRRLQRGYVDALEASLLEGAIDPGAVESDDRVTRDTISRTLALLPIDRHVPGALRPSGAERRGEPARTAGANPTGAESPGVPSTPTDPITLRGIELDSRHLALVRRALADGPLDPTHVPVVIRLLAWNEVASEAMRALRSTGEVAHAALLEALADPARPFAVRRRIPRIFEPPPAPAIRTGLVRGLEDERFEVRYHCARALLRLSPAPGGGIEPAAVLERIRQEAARGRRVWESQSVLDRGDRDARDAALDQVLEARANHGIEHVFTLMKLVFPREPLEVAHRGLYTEDTMLRGTALEYLESILPADVWEALRPCIGDERPASRVARPTETVLQDLLRSNRSIVMQLEAMKRKDGPVG